MRTNFQANHALYLFLSFLSSLFELGPVILLLSSTKSITNALIVGLCYQLGNLISGTIRLSRGAIWVLAAGALSLSLFGQEFLLASYGTVALASIVLQSLRRTISSDSSLKVSTATKRLVRIIGFGLSGFFSYLIGTGIIFLLLGLSILALRRPDLDSCRAENFNLPKVTPIALLMVIHQSHYFSYAYVLPALFLLHLSAPPYLAGILFTVGWFSYVSTEKLVRSSRLVAVLVIGHLLVTFGLLCIGYFQSSLALVIIAWFLSGLGGGTVFCLTRMNAQAPLEGRTHIEFWEDLGHVIGVALSVLLVGMVLTYPFTIFYVSAIIAIITALGGLFSDNWVHRMGLTSGASVAE